MNIENRIRIAVLTKYYGKLLTDKQRRIIDMYVDNNLSLSEVSNELKITRQAVKDALDTAIQTLEEYEKNLHFILRDDKIKSFLEEKSLDITIKLQILSILEDN